MRVVKTACCSVSFLDGDIVHAHFQNDHLVSPEEVQEMFDVIEHERNGKKALLVVTVGENTTMSNEARVHASSEASCKYIAADAIVLRDFAHNLTANVFVRHYKPHRPIQMFPDMEHAIEWLKQQHALIEARPNP